MLAANVVSVTERPHYLHTAVRQPKRRHKESVCLSELDVSTRFHQCGERTC